MAAGRRGRAAGAARAARLELDGERALGRADALRDPQGRLRLAARGLGLVRRRRPAGRQLLAEAAAARRRHGAVASDRLPAGGRPAVSELPQMPLEGIKVVEAATLFAAPLAAMMLGDYGADVVKIEHPHRVDPARGHGPSKDGIGLWFKALARNKRLVTLDLSKPAGADIFLRLAERSDVVLENFRPGHAGALGRRLGRALGGEPPARARAGQRLRPDRPVRPARRLRHARRGDERLRRAQRRPEGRRCSRRSRSRTASRHSRPRSRS